jgi:signal peptidase I
MRGYVRAAAIALVAMVLLRGCGIQAFKIQAGSMLPTLLMGDYVLVNKLSYGLAQPNGGGWFWRYGDPRQGDVVVFAEREEPEQHFVKRVAAVAGETVEIRQRRLLVGGVPRDGSYAYFTEAAGVHSERPRDNFGPVQVPAGHVFVLGDNRDRSIDSRYFGSVAISGIKGRAFLIYWSQDDLDSSIRWERLGSGID